MSFGSLAAAPLFTSHRLRPLEAAPWIIAIAVYFLLPGQLGLATQILIMVLFALSLDLIVGYAGIISLGHAAFFGTGAYTVGLLSKYGWTEPLTGLLAAAAIAGLAGFGSGWALLRTRGLTLLMLTIAVAIMLHELANDLDGITGGFDGLPVTTAPIFGIFRFSALSYDNQYFYVLAVLFLIFMVVRATIYSPFGRSLVGIKESAARMHAIGSPVHLRLVQVYAMSAAIAGVAGGLFAQANAYLTTHVLSFGLSGDVLIMVILGGAGQLYGAFLGATAFLVLERQTERVLGTEFPYWQLAVGLALVLTVLSGQRGLLGAAASIVRWVRRRTL
jgi:branched-chain amino acid transport system permease protein